ncbi:MAG: PAS domain S-box protein [Opitutales bacterium]|nr:PAS domain S-box protein [Opitutales bacterium]
MDTELSFDLLFRMANDAVFVADAVDGTLLAANERAEEWTGRSAADLRDIPFTDMVAVQDRAWVESALNANSDDGTFGFIDVSLQRAGTAPLPCELTARAASAEGRRVHVIVLRDISERMRAMEDINLRNEAIASVASGVTIADARHPDLPLIYVNRGFERITGYSAKEAVGRSCRFLQAHDRDQDQLDVLRKALREGEPCNVRLRNYRKDGSLFWNELHISPVRTAEGELTHFIGIQIDVTDRVLDRSRLEASERRYRLLADSIDDVILRFLPDGMIDYASPSCERLLGIAPADITGRSVAALIRGGDEVALSARWRGIIESGESVTTTFEMYGRDVPSLWVEATESPLPLESEDAPAQIIAVVRDVTPRVQAAEEMRRALDKEKQLNEIKTRFIRMVSHEFRTPMTGIRASASFLRDYGASVTPEKRERHFVNIENALKRMNDMLDDVLFVSRGEAGKVPFDPKPVDLAAFCESLLEELRTIHGTHRIRFSTDLPPGGTYRLDTALLNHILHNLLSNAIKYSPSSEPARFHVEKEGTALRLTVEDRGIGIPEEDHADLFEPFHRAGNVGTVKGTGLGLYIAKRSAELHSGTIRFSSTLGEGSRFEVTLPAETQTDSRSTTP